MKITYTSFVPKLISEIIANNKVVTRRPVKWKSKTQVPPGALNAADTPFHVKPSKDGMTPDQILLMSHIKRFCEEGDLLYIRETSKQIDGGYAYYASSPELSGPWTPSIHMRRQASRLTAQVLELTIERLGNIEMSEQNAKDEGFNSLLEFKNAWAQIYGEYDPTSLVWCARFKCHHCNVDKLLESFK